MVRAGVPKIPLSCDSAGKSPLIRYISASVADWSGKDGGSHAPSHAPTPQSSEAHRPKAVLYGLINCPRTPAGGLRELRRVLRGDHP